MGMRTMNVLRIQINDDEIPWDSRCVVCTTSFYYVRNNGIFPALSVKEEDYFDVFIPINAEKVIIEHGLNKKELSRDEITKRGDEMKAVIFDIDEVPTTDARFMYTIGSLTFKAWTVITPIGVAVIAPLKANKIIIARYDVTVLKETQL